MDKIILLGASWCPITKEARELFDGLKKEMPNFDYEYIDIDSEGGKELVKKLSVTDVPKIIIDNKIIFHGNPSHEELIKLLKKN